MSAWKPIQGEIYLKFVAREGAYSRRALSRRGIKGFTVPRGAFYSVINSLLTSLFYQQIVVQCQDTAFFCSCRKGVNLLIILNYTWNSSYLFNGCSEGVQNFTFLHRLQTQQIKPSNANYKEKDFFAQSKVQEHFGNLKQVCSLIERVLKIEV